MGKKLFAVSTVALLVSFVAGWAVSDSQARVDPVQTFETTTAKQMPFANYSYHARFAPAAWVQVNDETPLGGPSVMLVQDQPRC
jgi:hypothetical protein